MYLGEVLIISVVIPVAHGHSCLGHSSKNVRNESCSRNSVDQTELLFLSLRMERKEKIRKKKRMPSWVNVPTAWSTRCKHFLKRVPNQLYRHGACVLVDMFSRLLLKAK